MGLHAASPHGAGVGRHFGRSGKRPPAERQIVQVAVARRPSRISFGYGCVGHSHARVHSRPRQTLYFLRASEASNELFKVAEERS